MTTHLSVPNSWRLNRARYGLVGGVCKSCGAPAFPPRATCQSCGGVEFREGVLPGSGQILSWTTIHVPPEGFEAPYTVAIVQMEGGVRVVGQVVGDNNGIGVGANVRVVFRRIGETKDGLLLYGFKFVLQD